MLLVTDLKVITTKYDYQEIRKYISPITSRLENPGSFEESKITTEMVKGKRFIINGREIVIGWDNTTQESLGIPLTVVQDMSWFQEEKFRNMSLLEHLKCWWEYR